MKSFAHPSASVPTMANASAVLTAAIAAFDVVPSMMMERPVMHRAVIHAYSLE